ncbi:MAG: site-specific DNA-methyltransferase [Candidatus Poribacteria bacterium]|nr:site-specific DNA-methyltransferase [Candidatus Poribacteria bacterium]
MNPLKRNTILCGDAFRLIRDLPDDSVRLMLTSPPYYRQRVYLPEGDAAELGREKRVADYLDRLIAICKECVRVTHPTGSVVFNLGDVVRNGGLLGIPYRFAVAALDIGSVRLVNEITWVKKNARPRGHRRRLTSTTEPFFHFVKSDRYVYRPDDFMRTTTAATFPPKHRDAERRARHYLERIPRSDLASSEKRLARKAVMDALRDTRDGEITGFKMKIRGVHRPPREAEGGQLTQWRRHGFAVCRFRGRPMKRDVIESAVECLPGATHTAIFPVGIACELIRLLTEPGDLVLDPFIGSGTTALACVMTGRDYLGFELNPAFCREAEKLVRFPANDNA